jgi:hypothetical protein
VVPYELTLAAASPHRSSPRGGRAPFERPAKMPFAGAAALRAVFGKLPDIEIPGTDEAAVEIHLAGAVGRGAVRAEGVEKR